MNSISSFPSLFLFYVGKTFFLKKGAASPHGPVLKWRQKISRILNPGSFTFTSVRPPGFPAAAGQAGGFRDGPAPAGYAPDRHGFSP